MESIRRSAFTNNSREDTGSLDWPPTVRNKARPVGCLRDCDEQSVLGGPDAYSSGGSLRQLRDSLFGLEVPFTAD
jgi:hypothetical protein